MENAPSSLVRIFICRLVKRGGKVMKCLGIGMVDSFTVQPKRLQTPGITLSPSPE